MSTGPIDRKWFREIDGDKLLAYPSGYVVQVWPKENSFFYGVFYGAELKGCGIVKTLLEAQTFSLSCVQRLEAESVNGVS